jgi:cob(I)alamin adenosyltransferase
MRIYTRGGDQGETSLFDGTRVRKTDPRVEAYGSVDELNAHLSWARTQHPRHEVTKCLERIQHELFTVGADLATPRDAKRETKRVTADHVKRLEDEIDRFMAEVGQPGGFVLPGESPEGARLHVCRTICRRAERLAVSIGPEGAGTETVRYLNRLSDLLYAMAVWTDKVAMGKDLQNPRY